MITVVGAGPAGLALAYHLRHKGLDFQILEKGEVAESWASYYDHLRLHTRKANVALPGLSLPASADTFPSRAQYLSYLRQYAEHFAFPIQTGVEVLDISYRGSWRLRTTHGCLETDILVMATGIFNTPVLPTFKGQARFQGELRHAQTYRCPRPYVGKRVLVVGAGNSGVGIALGLAEARVDVGLVVRDGVQPVPMPKTALGTRLKARLIQSLPEPLANSVLGFVRRDYADIGLPKPSKPPLDVVPVVGLGLVRAVKKGLIRVHPALKSLTETVIRFADGSAHDYDVVLLATGYRPTLRTLKTSFGLDERGRLTGTPPGLYSLGLTYPTLEPFLVAVKREAADLADRLGAQAAARGS